MGLLKNLVFSQQQKDKQVYSYLAKHVRVKDTNLFGKSMEINSLNLKISHFTS